VCLIGDRPARGWPAPLPLVTCAEKLVEPLADELPPCDEKLFVVADVQQGRVYRDALGLKRPVPSLVDVLGKVCLRGPAARLLSEAARRGRTRVDRTPLALRPERRIVSEVRLAERECQRSREALEQIETSILPRAAATLRRKTEQLSAGKISADDDQGRLDDAAEVTQSHRDAIVRLRRAMLDVNTAVGLRIRP
jgi:hypothetical protein